MIGGFIRKRIGKRHIIIPDNQIHEDTDVCFMGWIGNYVEEHRPDVLVHLGDLADVPSLNKHAEIGSMEIEGKRVRRDIEAAKHAIETLVKAIKHKPARMVLTMGNHEDRIDREIEAQPKFEGMFSTDDLGYAKAGFEVYPFLRIAKIDGIEYCHYFQSGSMGKPVSSAKALLALRHSSAIMGHSQTFDIAHHRQSDHLAIISGACYLHDEKYLKPQGNVHRRQIVVLNEVANGTAYPMFVSLKFLQAKYS